MTGDISIIQLVEFKFLLKGEDDEQNLRIPNIRTQVSKQTHNKQRH